MGNRKIINATSVTLGDITFKSKLEGKLFACLQEQGFNPKYEPYKFHIWEGFKPTVPFYTRDKKTRTLSRNNTKIIDITYTPDIVFDYNGHKIFMEVKPDGFTNDVYPYKQKLFRKYMETNLSQVNPIFVRVGTKKSLLEFIEILKHLDNEEFKRNIPSDN